MYVNLVFLKLFVQHSLLNSWRFLQICYYYLHLRSVSFASHRLCSVSFASHRLCSVSFASHRLCSVSFASHRLCSVSFASHRLCSVSFAAHRQCCISYRASTVALSWKGLHFSAFTPPPPPTPTPMLSACCLIANTRVFSMFLQCNIQYNNTLLILKKEIQFHAVWYYYYQTPTFSAGCLVLANTHVFSMLSSITISKHPRFQQAVW